MATRTKLTKAQGIVLAAAFLPMLGTAFFGGRGTFTNISRAYGSGTAMGAVAAGEGATAVLALVLMGLTMLGQSSPRVIRLGLWALPAAASVMAASAAQDPGRIAIYAITPMGMCVSAEGMAFLARRIVVHQEGRDAEAEAKAAAVVRELAYQRAVAANHPDAKVKAKADRASWKLARKVGVGDYALGLRLLEVQRERVTTGADAALAAMFTTAAPAIESTPDTPTGTPEPTAADVDANQEESQQGTANQSSSDLRESTPEEPVESGDSEPAARPVPLPAAGPRRRPTGPVPAAARSPRPTRSPEELLSQARKVTADWADGDLTAEAIRKALRTAPAKARLLRDTLRAERAGLAAA
ncbi:conjugal transfer protein [Streptomyces sp. V4-01]|uniref:Conjugal transfer protein n=1 Tax=Actinacidiphila polyblastidii TaxID=3110430 RepID=A0ABU7PK22_9ACTN|nr:conjugal transfer protein [Streptomyces sp. V4-01]